MAEAKTCSTCVYCSYDVSWGRYECKVKKAASRFAKPGEAPEPFETPHDRAQKSNCETDWAFFK